MLRKICAKVTQFGMGLATRPRSTAIRSLAASGEIAILLVEQYYDFARDLSDYYLVMERGEIILRGEGRNMDKDGAREALARCLNRGSGLSERVAQEQGSARGGINVCVSGDSCTLVFGRSSYN